MANKFDYNKARESGLPDAGIRQYARENNLELVGAPTNISMRDAVKGGLSRKEVRQYAKENNLDIRKRGIIGETTEDIGGIFSGIGESYKNRKENILKISPNQNRASEVTQVAGQSLGFLGDVVGETLVGAGKALLPQPIEKAIGNTVTSGVSKIASTKTVSDAMQKYQQFKLENPEFAGNIEAVANIADFASNFIGAGAAAKGGKIALKAGKGAAVDTLESRFVKEATEIARRGATTAKGAVVKTPEQAVENVSKNLLDLVSNSGGKQAKQRVIDKYIPEEIHKFVTENGYFNQDNIKDGRYNPIKDFENIDSNLASVETEALSRAKNTDQTFTRDELVNAVLKNIDAEKFPLVNIEKLQTGITGVVDRYLKNKNITGDAIPAYNILDIRRQLDKKAFNAGKALKSESADIFRNAADGVRDIVNTKISGGDLGDLLKLEKKLILSKDFLNDVGSRAIKGGKLTDLVIRGATGLATAGAVGGVPGLIAGAVAQGIAGKVASSLAKKSIVGITESGALKKAVKGGLRTVIDEGDDILSFAKRYNVRPETAKQFIDEISIGNVSEEAKSKAGKELSASRIAKESEIESKIVELAGEKDSLLENLNGSIYTIKAIDDVDTLVQHLVKVHNVPEEIASKYAPVLSKLDKAQPIREQLNNIANEVLVHKPKELAKNNADKQKQVLINTFKTKLNK